ncbi:cyclophilin-like fold protein [Nocardia sp. AG03]|uniref:cyclophilin-like fold protein n=1 Tax=Nocardia sp. AG03 TaxID=3025312 RepID=UPI0024186FDF|nr:cyclophilin-like fold protein [Nocardia sp. AG03]
MRALTTLIALTTLTAAATVTACTATPPAPAPLTSTEEQATASPAQEATFMQIQLTLGTAEATARLYDNATAHDFATLLPLTLDVHDLGGREKAGTLPRELAGGQGRSGYRAGQLGYWAPSHDLALYYLEDGFRVPSPGIVMIGEIESGLDAITTENASTLIITAA